MSSKNRLSTCSGHVGNRLIWKEEGKENIHVIKAKQEVAQTLSFILIEEDVSSSMKEVWP